MCCPGVSVSIRGVPVRHMTACCHLFLSRGLTPRHPKTRQPGAGPAAADGGNAEDEGSCCRVKKGCYHFARGKKKKKKKKRSRTFSLQEFLGRPGTLHASSMVNAARSLVMASRRAGFEPPRPTPASMLHWRGLLPRPSFQEGQRGGW